MTARHAWSAIGLAVALVLVVWTPGVGAAVAESPDPGAPVGAFLVSPDAVAWLVRLGAFTLGVLSGR